MRPGDLREMSDADLIDQIRTARRELFGLRFQHATGELENTGGLRNAKRDLARALTIARERGIPVDHITPTSSTANTNG